MLTPMLLSSAGLDRLRHTPRPAPSDLPRGQVNRCQTQDGRRQTYFLYVPRSAGRKAPLMVSVHGVSRNAREHAGLLARHAERYGAILVAPLFDEATFTDYQRLGRRGRGPRADFALDAIIGEVLFKTGADTRCLYMFGYSGGGQFVHRYAMAYPERVAGVVIGAAGWYTFPDPKLAFPRGIKSSAKLPGVRFCPNRFLRVPMCVIVGGDDTERDPELNASERIDAQQGKTRLERARNWLDTMSEAACRSALNTDYRLEIMPGIQHSFKKGVRRGQLGERIFDFLFARKTNRELAGATLPSSRNERFVGPVSPNASKDSVVGSIPLLARSSPPFGSETATGIRP